MTDYLAKSLAASTIAEAFPEKTIEQWELWLQNNRNPSRKAAYRIPFERLGVMVIYKPEEIDKFIAWEKQRQLGSIKLSSRAMEVITAYGIGSAGGGSTGRKFSLGGVNLQYDEILKKPYISLILNDPLMVFRLELDEARALRGELTETIIAGERIKNES